ncbi:hypothetical protein BDZ89DRAFT_1012174 [Hymenopellis radicata]|nr:hypothetical protein BDZ89DRAFT_1012174 [Hymenopellis radicata]
MSTAVSELVIRDVTPEIWTFSRPFKRAGFLPWGGRSTAIKLSTGDVWVLASTPLTDDTSSALNNLGPVKWIVAGDAEHHMFLGEYKKAYPDAKLVVVDSLLQRKQDEGLEVAGAYGADPEGTEYGYEAEIKALYFSGFANKDVAFYHIASKTLVVADLLFNLPGTEQYSKSKQSSKVPLVGKIDPFGGLEKRMLWALGKDKDAMRRDARTVSEWDIQRIIMCHGDVIEENAGKAWKAAYSKYLT